MSLNKTRKRSITKSKRDLERHKRKKIIQNLNSFNDFRKAFIDVGVNFDDAVNNMVELFANYKRNLEKALEVLHDKKKTR